MIEAFKTLDYCSCKACSEDRLENKVLLIFKGLFITINEFGVILNKENWAEFKIGVDYFD